jgi:hypothetical protein
MAVLGHGVSWQYDGRQPVESVQRARRLRRRGHGVAIRWRQRMSLPPRVTHRPIGGVRPALALLHGH